jgi:hypothetical protein
MIHAAHDIGRRRSPEPLAPREMMRPDQETQLVLRQTLVMPQQPKVQLQL